MWHNCSAAIVTSQGLSTDPGELAWAEHPSGSDGMTLSAIHSSCLAKLKPCAETLACEDVVQHEGM